MCAQMVPRWTPTYGQDMTTLHHEEREEKGDSQDGDREEGGYMYERESEGSVSLSVC